jgi:hypothetical protein
MRTIDYNGHVPLDEDERRQIHEDVMAALAAAQENVFRLAAVLGVSRDELTCRAIEQAGTAA